jgi:hypothetical protein
MNTKMFSTMSLTLLSLFVLMTFTPVEADIKVWVVLRTPSNFNASAVPIAAVETMEGYLGVALAEEAAQEAASNVTKDVETFGSEVQDPTRRLRGGANDARRLPGCCCGYSSCAQCYASGQNKVLCNAYCSGGACGARRDLTGSNVTSIPVLTEYPIARQLCLKINPTKVRADVLAANMQFYTGYGLNAAKPEVYFCRT